MSEKDKNSLTEILDIKQHYPEQIQIELASLDDINKRRIKERSKSAISSNKMKSLSERSKNNIQSRNLSIISLKNSIEQKIRTNTSLALDSSSYFLKNSRANVFQSRKSSIFNKDKIAARLNNNSLQSDKKNDEHKQQKRQSKLSYSQAIFQPELPNSSEYLHQDRSPQGCDDHQQQNQHSKRKRRLGGGALYHQFLSTSKVMTDVLKFSLPIIWHMGGKCKVIIGLSLTVFQQIFSFLIPFMFKFVLNNITQRQQHYVFQLGSIEISSFTTFVTLTVTFMLLDRLFDSTARYLFAQAVSRSRPCMLQIIIEHIQSQSIEFFNNKNTQALINVINSGLYAFSSITYTFLFIQSPILKFVIVFFLFASNFGWPLIVLQIIYILFEFQIKWILFSGKVKTYNLMSNKMDDYNWKLTQLLDKIELTKLSGAQDHQIRRIYKSRLDYDKAILEDRKAKVKVMAAQFIISMIFLAAFMMLCRYQIQKKGQSVGDFALMLTYLDSMYSSFNAFSQALLLLKQAKGDATSFFQVLLSQNIQCVVKTPMHKISNLKSNVK